MWNYVYGVFALLGPILLKIELQNFRGLKLCTALLAGRPHVEGQRTCCDTDMDGQGEFIVYLRRLYDVVSLSTFTTIIMLPIEGSLTICIASLAGDPCMEGERSWNDARVDVQGKFFNL